ncbi:winged helix DNA-binding domain-containing protein [Nocardioides aequoreus]|uniref:winged helix DNA-binding domain-containing protein n=1 Tax=Nocardioides aequoreus TaxID=397278 RepID=UPI0004C4308F|nr:winged helix DNA-binding domain-containing protein [Nocardioides aequoreus]
MRRVSDQERRARLVTRHALAAPAASVEQAVEAVVCLHATEPASVFLAVQARTDVDPAAVQHALYAERSVVKQLAMRRTLFAFPRGLLPAVWGSASRRVAVQQRTRLAKEVVQLGIAADADAWLRRVDAQVLASLRDDGPATTVELRRRVPDLEHRFEGWQGASSPIAGRVLTVLGAEARLLRGANELGWRQARHRWCLPEQWLDEVPAPEEEAAGYRELVGRWLARFGPGTETDLVWWLGATKGAVRRALADLEAVAVQLDSGATAYLLPDDLEPVGEARPVASLLPTLDPTLMGWKERDFYLDPADVPYLFDTNGNGGTTAWWDGRVVGCWVQDDDGRVEVLLRHDPGAEALRALEVAAERLTTWLDGDRVNSVYASSMQRGARLP